MADSAPASSDDWLRRPWLRRLAVALGSIAALILVAWLAVPPIVRAQLESRLTDALHRRTTVEKVAFDPFSLRVTITKLAIARMNPPPMMSPIVANGSGNVVSTGISNGTVR